MGQCSDETAIRQTPHSNPLSQEEHGKGCEGGGGENGGESGGGEDGGEGCGGEDGGEGVIAVTDSTV